MPLLNVKTGCLTATGKRRATSNGPKVSRGGPFYESKLDTDKICTSHKLADTSLYFACQTTGGISPKFRWGQI